MKISFEVEGKPQGKGRPRAYKRGSNISFYTPENTVNYEQLIKQNYLISVNKLAQKISKKPLKLGLVAVQKIPQSLRKEEKKIALEGHLKPLNKPDLDNIIKVVADALNNLAYFDDRQIVEINAKKIFGNEPKIIIELEEIDE